jgi:MSHA pilin protein MshC
MSLSFDFKNNNGFSLAEVTITLVIIAIISTIIISKSGTFSTDLISQTEILKTHIRHAQALGMTGTDSNDICGVKCDTAFYWMFKGNDPDANIIMLPDDQRYNTGNDGKLDLAEKKIAIATAFTVFFDQRGIPYSASNTPLVSDLTIDVTPAGEVSPTESIIVTQLTGFIP